jgi:hypothetical protein
MKLPWIKTISILLTLCLLSFAGCKSAPPKAVTVERTITAKGCTRAFQEEHKNLLVENIRLRADLKACQAK